MWRRWGGAVGQPLLLNVGSVGQPRDGDWRAAYCIYSADNENVEQRRVKYDLDTAQKKIIAAGLPRFLAERLAIGRWGPRKVKILKEKVENC